MFRDLITVSTQQVSLRDRKHEGSTIAPSLMPGKKGGIGLGRASGTPELRVKGGQDGDNPQGRVPEKKLAQREFQRFSEGPFSAEWLLAHAMEKLLSGGNNARKK